MGAHNALAIRQQYGRHLPSSTMHVLTYMALVSLDDDPNPWFSQGHLVLAEFGLFREVTCRCGHCRACRTHFEAVRRALKPALDLGAVTLERGGARHRQDGRNTALYRLNLAGAVSIDPGPDRADEPRSHPTQTVSDPPPVDPDPDSTPHGLRGQHPTVCVANTPRFAWPTPHGLRGPNEEEENDERREEEVVTSQGDLTTRAYPDEQANEINHGEVGEDSPDAVRRDAAPAAIHDEHDDGESAKPQVAPVVRSTASPVEESPHSQGAPQEQGIDRRVSRPAGVPDHVARLLPPHLRPTRLRAS